MFHPQTLPRGIWSLGGGGGGEGKAGGGGRGKGEAGVGGGGSLWPESHAWPAARTETQTLPFEAEVASEDIKPAIMRAKD